MEVLQSVTADSSLAGGALLIAAYVAASVLLLPASVLTLGAGYIFGPLTGTGLVSVGATLGAGAAFLVSRGVARPLVEKQLAGNEKLAAVDRAVAAKGAQVVLLLRLSPLFPFSLLNYGLGLSQVREATSSPPFQAAHTGVWSPHSAPSTPHPRRCPPTWLLFDPQLPPIHKMPTSTILSAYHSACLKYCLSPFAIMIICELSSTDTGSTRRTAKTSPRKSGQWGCIMMP